MQEKPEDSLRKVFSVRGDQGIDQAIVVRLKKRVAQDFREQLLVGAPSNEDEEGLRQLSAQLRTGRLMVKLYLCHRLHAKLYVLCDYPPKSPVYAYVARFRDERVWEQIMRVLRERCRVEAGGEGTPLAGIIDSQSVRSTDPWRPTWL